MKLLEKKCTYKRSICSDFFIKYTTNWCETHAHDIGTSNQQKIYGSSIQSKNLHLILGFLHIPPWFNHKSLILTKKGIKSSTILVDCKKCFWITTCGKYNIWHVRWALYEIATFFGLTYVIWTQPQTHDWTLQPCRSTISLNEFKLECYNRFTCMRCV